MFIFYAIFRVDAYFIRSNMGEYLHKEYEKAENEANGVILEDCSQSSLFKFVPYGETHYLLQILGDRKSVV